MCSSDLIGLTLVAVGLLITAFAASSISASVLAWSFGAIAIFMGTVMGVVQLTVQLAAGSRQLGAGAATVQFSRSLGAAVGTALVATILFATMAHSDPAAGAAFGRIIQEGPQALDTFGMAQQTAIRSGLDDAFRNAFLCIAGFAVVAMGLVWTLPIRRL